MQTRLGLTPEEMITIFNRMYLEVWAKTRERVTWEAANISRQLAEGKDVDIAALLIELMEVVITAARDGTILTLYENNEKIYEDLKAAGIQLPEQLEVHPAD
ncbi:MAG: hypothetical protein HY319_19380 [Armatimonadetes bacterium]|nr:hypothetical protein [Armatimonadota bacterium]